MDPTTPPTTASDILQRATPPRSLCEDRRPSPPSINISENERWGSALGGAALLLAGLSRGKMSGLLLGLIGGSLIYRGATGHCTAYQSLGISTAEGARNTVTTRAAFTTSRCRN